MTNTERVREYEQPGWNDGYLIGEQERLTLAAECSNLRNEVRELRARLRRLQPKDAT